MKDKQKKHWLKIDFNRWRDEDDSEPEENGGAEEQDLDDVSFNGFIYAFIKFIYIFSRRLCDAWEGSTTQWAVWEAWEAKWT